MADPLPLSPDSQRRPPRIFEKYRGLCLSLSTFILFSALVVRGVLELNNDTYYMFLVFCETFMCHYFWYIDVSLFDLRLRRSCTWWKVLFIEFTVKGSLMVNVGATLHSFLFLLQRWFEWDLPRYMESMATPFMVYAAFMLWFNLYVEAMGGWLYPGYPGNDDPDEPTLIWDWPSV